MPSSSITPKKSIVLHRPNKSIDITRKVNYRLSLRKRKSAENTRFQTFTYNPVELGSVQKRHLFAIEGLLLFGSPVNLFSGARSLWNSGTLFLGIPWVLDGSLAARSNNHLIPRYPKNDIEEEWCASDSQRTQERLFHNLRLCMWKVWGKKEEKRNGRRKITFNCVVFYASVAPVRFDPLVKLKWLACSKVTPRGVARYF